MKKGLYFILTIVEFFVFIFSLWKSYKEIQYLSFCLLVLNSIYLLYKILRRINRVKINYNKRMTIPKEIKKVSVVVPNYNYANYIVDRIDSILKQTYPIYELILLDDCSSDNSALVIRNKIKEIKKDYPDLKIKFIQNKKNSGNVFKQWQKAFEEASGDYLWIAEADDLCEPYFLNVVMQGFKNNSVIVSYTESASIDSDGLVISKDSRQWADLFDTKLWNRNYILSGRKEIERSLCINNSMVNVSAVVFKKVEKIDTKKILQEAQKFKLSGDWYFYFKYLLYGSISYSTDTLNYHRIHENSVTTKTDDMLRYNEIVSIQDLINEQLKIPKKYRMLALKFRKNIKEYLNLEK